MGTATADALGGPGLRAARRAARGATGPSSSAEAEPLARCCHRMAERFARGGRLVAFGRSPAARSDARHVAVEFVHPVIVGKRALPAIGLAAEGGPLAAQVEGTCRARRRRDRLRGRGATRRDAVPRSGSRRGRGLPDDRLRRRGRRVGVRPGGDDPFVRQELVETLYHVLWELVHVFFDHRGLLEGREQRATHDTGASSFLYPFLSEAEDDLDAVLDDVRRSVLIKADEVCGAARADAERQPRRPDRGRRPAARAARRRRQAPGVRQRRLRDGRHGSGG